MKDLKAIIEQGGVHVLADVWRAVAQMTSYKLFSDKMPGGKELIERALGVN